MGITDGNVFIRKRVLREGFHRSTLKFMSYLVYIGPSDYQLVLFAALHISNLQCTKNSFIFAIVRRSPVVRHSSSQQTSSTSPSPPSLGPKSPTKVRPNNSSSIWKQIPAIAGSYRPLLSSSRMKACCAHATS